MAERSRTRWGVVGLAAAGLSLAPLAAGADDRPVYVALGDSYSSGEGVDPFLPGTDMEGNFCHRSTRAYSQRVAEELSYRRLFFACRGATTADFFGGGRSVDLPDGQAAAIPRAARLITLTIGGNDVGFSAVMVACTFHNCTEDRAFEDLPDRIEALRPSLRAVYSAVRARAPEATVLVLGYPRFVTNENETRWCYTDIGIGRHEKTWLNVHLAHLNDVIAAEAAEAGVTYVDTERAFAGHEVCTRESWSFGVHGRHWTWSYHPNAKGQEALAAAVVAIAGSSTN